MIRSKYYTENVEKKTVLSWPQFHYVQSFYRIALRSLGKYICEERWANTFQSKPNTYQCRGEVLTEPFKHWNYVIWMRMWICWQIRKLKYLLWMNWLWTSYHMSKVLIVSSCSGAMNKQQLHFGQSLLHTFALYIIETWDLFDMGSIFCTIVVW